jgi:hypothetical protein
MKTVITSEKIELPPGAVLKLLGNWQEYQRMVLQLGDRSIPRIKYRYQSMEEMQAYFPWW